jgi:hypothetical protein
MDPIKDPPFFFSVKHIIKPVRTKLIYGVRYKDLDYFLFKTFGLNDCQQLDDNPKLHPDIFNTMCEVITEIEKEYNKTPPLEFINMDVFNILVRTKNPRYDDHSKDDK